MRVWLILLLTAVGLIALLALSNSAAPEAAYPTPPLTEGKPITLNISQLLTPDGQTAQLGHLTIPNP